MTAVEYLIKQITKEKGLTESYDIFYEALEMEREQQKQTVMPRLFFLVEEIGDGVWEQITIGLSTYEEAKAYKDKWDGRHPNAFIVATLNEA